MLHSNFDVNSRIVFRNFRRHQILTNFKVVIGLINYLQLRTHAMVSLAPLTLAGVNGHAANTSTLVSMKHSSTSSKT